MTVTPVNSLETINAPLWSASDIGKTEEVSTGISDPTCADSGKTKPHCDSTVSEPERGLPVKLSANMRNSYSNL